MDPKGCPGTFLPIPGLVNRYLYIFILAHHPLLHPRKLTWNLKIGHPKRKLVLQPSIFRCELLVSGRVSADHRNCIPVVFHQDHIGIRELQALLLKLCLLAKASGVSEIFQTGSGWT